MTNANLFCGIDLGTQGARCIFSDGLGHIAAEGEAEFGEASFRKDERFEQEPREWFAALGRSLRDAVSCLKRAARVEDVRAIGVTSTSGTLCVLDDAYNPLCPAMMYSDSRSREEAQAVQKAAGDLTDRLGYRFKPSFALPKILWLKNHRPELFEKACIFTSPTDLVIGWLTGSWGTTDQTNALKYGYDLLENRWPGFIEHNLGIPRDKLPQVTTTGDRVGELQPRRAEALGLLPGVPVAAGLTDGCAAQVSSGAVNPGDFNTTIGTTLVIKGVTNRLLIDPLGRIYCHRHPNGWWLPGGASNTGAECLAREFGDQETWERSPRAASLSPTSLVAYPLVGTGERFPFVSAEAEGFLIGQPASRNELFAAYLEGVACVERLAFETLEEMGADLGDRVYSAGGGAQSESWLQIRADVLQKRVLRPEVTGAAMGAAIVAAAMGRYEDIPEAAGRMVRIESEKTPRPEQAEVYEAKYRKFVAACDNRGYLDG